VVGQEASNYNDFVPMAGKGKRNPEVKASGSIETIDGPKTGEVSKSHTAL
jgi:hypothetical protein